MNYNDITPLKFWCQKILPLSYDDSLSYYETLCRFADKVNELIERLNLYQEEYRDYVDSQVAYLKRYIDDNDYALKVKLEQKINNFKNEQDAKIQDIENKMLELRDHVQSKLYEYKYALSEFKDFVINDQLRQDDYWQAQLSELRDELCSIIGEYTNLIYNPTNGMISTIQQVINDMWNLLRYQAMTVTEFEWLNYDCDRWDSIVFSAFNFDLYGGTKYAKRICECWMISPFTGEKELVTSVIDKMIGDMYEGKTCSYWDSQNFTATAYDNANRTCQQFDFGA